MRLFFSVKLRRLFFAIFIPIIIIITTVVVWIFQEYKSLPEGSVRKFNRDYEPYKSGPIKIGGKMPWGPGESTSAPYLKIPESQKFYVSIAESNSRCSNEDCGIDGAIIQTLGGWLEAQDTGQSEVEASFGLDLPENQSIKSIVTVGNKDGKIVGIYLNKTYKDTLNILKNHPNLTNFDMLRGVNEFGKLKVGETAPLKPGDDISYLFSNQAEFPLDKIPGEKKFYLYGIQKRKNIVLGIDKIDKVDEEERKERNKYICFLGGCRYPEPDPPHDFLFAEIDEFGGWFLTNDNDNIKMIELFGLNPEDVLSGKSSLVVLTDAKGVIVALHPNKTISDAITILSQHPNLVDMKEIYR